MKLPAQMPQDTLAEKSLLGCLLIDGQGMDQISDLNMDKDDFFNPKLGMIFDVIRELFFNGDAVDYVNVCSKLNDRDQLEIVGGQTFIVDLIEDQISPANLYSYAKIVKEKSTMRQIIRTAAKVIESGTQFSGNVLDYLSDVESSFFKLTSQAKTGGLQDLKNFLKVNLKELEDPTRRQGEISGLPTGFRDLDKTLLGLQPGQLVILAARPGMGKTALGLSFALNAARQTGLPVAIFSLEMLAPELSMRLLTSEAEVDSNRIKMKNYLDTDLRNITKAVKFLQAAPIKINDSSSITLFDVRSQCRKLKAESGLGLVVIDYLQLMQPHYKQLDRVQFISEVSRGLKNLAKELECPIIALSQLNRAVESRPDKRPLISDLRESGSIEQDADVVLMIYRDDYYNPESKDKGIAEVIVAKNRAGERGTVQLSWVGSQMKFANLKQNSQYSQQQVENGPS